MRSRGLRGYTLVEVAVALAVLAVGAAGVIAVQKATGVGNVHARNIATANRIAAKWAERLQADSLQWNEISGYSKSHWLSKATQAPAKWFIPAEIAGRASPDADVLGADIFPPDPAASAFCAHLRLLALPGSAAHLTTPAEPPMVPAVRAEIRVFWRKSGDPVDCSKLPDAITQERERYGFVHHVAGITAPQ
ncbi:MAG TPA: prepilin-type N-terminal cleavage/methylation domain-containing protein [Polyangiaceae bacterium]|jgi:type IV pilus assembly protein PilV|nr:prepilin-type N-terminal cleavage/methylation domain-containing protein [Polyangiaceae bacterium]